VAEKFLEDVNVLELSPTDAPANRARKLFQKSKQKEQDPMFKLVDEYVQKSAPDKVKECMKAAMAELKKAKADMSDEQWSAFKKAFGMSDEGDAESKAACKKSADALDSALAIVKKSVEHLDQPTPIVGSALEALAALVGHTTVNKKIEQLPPEIKAQYDLVAKSAADNKAELELLKKSIADKERENLGKEFVAKASSQYSHVPLASDELGKLLLETNGNPALLTLLDRVEGALKKSALFEESGFCAVQKSSSKGAKIDELVKEYVKKSATPISKHEAMTRMLSENPEIFAEADRAQHGG
jgi:hypothetical protein